MSAAPALLPSIDAIDAAWLQAMFAASARGAVPPIAGFAVAPIGAGTSSETRRITLDYAGPPIDAPRSVICKFPSRSAGSHAGATAMGVYVRETEALRLIAANDACRIPVVHLAAAAPDALNLVMEDLSRTATPGDQLAGCTVSEAGAVIDELARLHSALPVNGPPGETAPRWLLRMRDLGPGMAATIARGTALARERFGARLTGDQLAVIAGCARIAGAWYARVPRRLAFTHGDPRVDNMLFQIVDGGTRAILIDWQLAGLRDPLYDVAYFLTGSLSVADRRAHERTLIARYAGRAGIDEPRAIADYCLSIVAGLLMTIVGIAALEPSATVDRLLLTLLDRTVAAVADWDGIGAIERATGHARGRAA